MIGDNEQLSYLCLEESWFACPKSRCEGVHVGMLLILKEHEILPAAVSLVCLFVLEPLV